jgi:hypothetical protein
MNNCSRWQYWRSSVASRPELTSDRDDDRRKSRFSRCAATRVRRAIPICHLIADCAGVAALLLTYPIYRSIDQVGRHCVSAFHCEATRAAAPAGDTQGLEFYRLQAAFVSGSPLPFSTPIRKHGCSLRPPPDRSWRAMRPSPVSQLL